jgi:hypothetical protein
MLLLGEMFLTVSNGDRDLVFGSRNHVEGAIIPLVLEYAMAGGRSDLAIAQVAALTSAHFGNCTD